MLTRQNRRSEVAAEGRRGARETAGYRSRRGPGRNAQVMRPDYPFAMRLPDGRTMMVAIPGRWTADDRDGTVLLLPRAVRFLDRVQALATPGSGGMTPGYIHALREALGLTQAEFGERIGVEKMTVSRWERGEFQPAEETMAAIEKLRASKLAKGVIVPG